MRKGRIKSPCVSLECIIPIEFCGGKTRFSHAIAANKRANSHNFKTKKLNLLTNTFLADYLMNRGKSSYMNNHLWKWIILSVRSLTVFEEKIALTVLAKLASLFFKNVHALFLFLSVNFIAWYNQNPSTPYCNGRSQSLNEPEIVSAHSDNISLHQNHYYVTRIRIYY